MSISQKSHALFGFDADDYALVSTHYDPIDAAGARWRLKGRKVWHTREQLERRLAQRRAAAAPIATPRPDNDNVDAAAIDAVAPATMASAATEPNALQSTHHCRAGRQLIEADCVAFIKLLGIKPDDAVIFMKDPEGGNRHVVLHGWYRNREQIKALHDGKGWGLYVVPHHMDGTGRLANDCIISSEAVTADWDHGRPYVPLHPTHHVSTSPGRSQDHWVFTRRLTPAEVQHIKTHMAHLFPGTHDLPDGGRAHQIDPACSNLGQAIRLPGSVNRKNGGLCRVEVTDGTAVRYEPEAFLEAFGFPPFPIQSQAEPAQAKTQAPHQHVAEVATTKPATAADPAPQQIRRYVEKSSKRPRGDGERGRLTMGAPAITWTDQKQWSQGAEHFKIVSAGQSWGFELYHDVSRRSPGYVSEADCRKKWEKAKTTGCTPNEAAGWLMKLIKSAVSTERWKEINRTHPFERVARHIAGKTASSNAIINPDGWYETPKASYGSKLWTGMPMTARAVLKVFRAAYRAGDNGNVPMTMRTLIEKTNLDPRTIGKWVEVLIAKGLLVERIPMMGDQPGMYFLAERGTDWNPTRKQYMTRPALIWETLPRNDDKRTVDLPTLNGFVKVFNARYDNPAWIALGPVGQEIADLVAATDHFNKTGAHMLAKRYLKANIGGSQDGIKTGLEALIATGLGTRVAGMRRRLDGIDMTTGKSVFTTSAPIYALTEYGVSDGKQRHSSAEFWRTHTIPEARSQLQNRSDRGAARSVR